MAAEKKIEVICNGTHFDKDGVHKPGERIKITESTFKKMTNAFRLPDSDKETPQRLLGEARLEIKELEKKVEHLEKMNENLQTELDKIRTKTDEK
jgi:hypothetical protein